MEFQEPLDLQNFPEWQQHWLARFERALADGNVDEQYQLVLDYRGDGSMEAEWHFADPAYFSLLFYGPAGLDCLYRLATNRQNLFTAARVLMDAAQGDSGHGTYGVYFTHRYLPRDLFEQVTERIRRNVRD
jgi:hypothetical protein